MRRKKTATVPTIVATSPARAAAEATPTAAAEVAARTIAGISTIVATAKYVATSTPEA